jgi:predicted dinucleotide-utilizing enzyme
MTAIPVLANSCARAATAAEARYRIDMPIAPARGVRVVALGAEAAAVACRVGAPSWTTARFFVCEAAGDKVRLRSIDGTEADLTDQLDEADVVLMIASEDAVADRAHFIGRACWERSIMTAGVVLVDSDGQESESAVAALRPHARVLLPSGDETDVVELLTALRA